MRFIIYACITCLSATWQTLCIASDEASLLFKTHKQALYQIRVIDNSSEGKSSYGTGFAISSDGLIATNYHVISQKVHANDDYSLSYRDSMGNEGQLEITAIDVVNDLAIVKLDTDIKHYLSLSSNDPIQGETIYSLGNPRGIGMSVNPGTYNGLKEHSFYPRIHFTGSVNPGMSGGPVLNEQGLVVGVNVATGGNSMGFLVPLSSLSALVTSASNAPQNNLVEAIRIQLFENQNRLYSAILASDWSTTSLGDARVPTEPVDFMPCWGRSNASRTDKLYLSAQSQCNLTDNIYIENNFQTGSIEIEFQWMQSESLSPRHFYNQVTRSYSHARAGNRANSRQVANFNCVQKPVNDGNHMAIDTVYCVRPYKKFKGLFDVLYISAHIGYNDRALISHFTLSGVSQHNADAFLRKMMETIQWP